MITSLILLLVLTQPSLQGPGEPPSRDGHASDGPAAISDGQAGDGQAALFPNTTTTESPKVEAEEAKVAMREFFSNADVRCLVFIGDNVKCSLGIPKDTKVKNKGVVFLKPKAQTVTKANIDTLIFTEMSKDPLRHLEKVLEDVYVPVLANPKNQEGWGEVVSKEVMDKVYGLLANVTITVGQTKGETCLPLPPLDLSGPTTSSKERIYLLESAEIGRAHV